MKDFIIVISIFLLVFVPGYFSEKYLKNSGEKIVEELIVIKDDILNNNMEHVELLYKIRDDWNKTQDTWNILSDHQNTDEIQREFELLIVNYEQGEMAEALDNLTEIKTMIEDTPRGESLSFVNIF